MKRRLQVVQESSCRARHGRHGGGDGGRGDLLVRAELRELGLRVRGGGLRLRTRPVALGGRPGTRGARIWRFSRIRVRGLPLRAGGRNHRDGRLRAVPLGSAPRRLGALRLALHLAEKLLRVTPNLHRALRPDVFLDLPPRAPVQLERVQEALVLLLRPPLALFRDGVRLPDLRRHVRGARGPRPRRSGFEHRTLRTLPRRAAARARAVRAERRRARAGGISGRDARARRATCTRVCYSRKPPAGARPGPDPGPARPPRGRPGHPRSPARALRARALDPRAGVRATRRGAAFVNVQADAKSALKSAGKRHVRDLALEIFYELGSDSKPIGFFSAGAKTGAPGGIRGGIPFARADKICAFSRVGGVRTLDP